MNTVAIEEDVTGSDVENSHQPPNHILTGKYGRLLTDNDDDQDLYFQL